MTRTEGGTHESKRSVWKEYASLKRNPTTSSVLSVRAIRGGQLASLRVSLAGGCYSDFRGRDVAWGRRKPHIRGFRRRMLRLFPRIFEVPAECGELSFRCRFRFPAGPLRAASNGGNENSRGPGPGLYACLLWYAIYSIP